LQPCHTCVIDQLRAGYRQLAAEIEQVVLDLDQAVLGSGNRQVAGHDDAERAIELIDAAHCLDAQRVLGYAAAVSQPGGAVIAGARDDPGEAMAHGGYFTTARLLQRAAAVAAVTGPARGARSMKAVAGRNRSRPSGGVVAVGELIVPVECIVEPGTHRPCRSQI